MFARHFAELGAEDAREKIMEELDDEKWVNEAVNEFLIENRHEVLLNPFLGLTMFTEFISRKIKEEAK